MYNQTIPGNKLRRNVPRRTKFNISVHESGETHNRLVEVGLSFQRDLSIPEEQALDLFFAPDDTHVHLRYVINIDLAAERLAFAKVVHDLYESEGGRVMASEELMTVDDGSMRSTLQPLAERGRAFFRAFFKPDAYSQHPIEKTKLIHDAVRSALCRPQLVTVSARHPLFPWSLVFFDPAYETNRLTTLDPLSFWGFRHEIQEDYECITGEINMPPNPRIVAAVCPDQDRDGQWHWGEDHPFRRVPGQVTRVTDVAALGKALGKFDGNCLYFFGHAHHEEPPVADLSYLEMQSEQISVVKLDLDYSAPDFVTRPVLAFLNGCRTSPLNVWNENTVVGYLCHKGHQRLCCVAPVAEIPASFAAEMSREFWSQFLEPSRLPLGSALRMARLHMLSEWNNPLGLLYSLFGKVDTQVGQTQAATP